MKDKDQDVARIYDLPTTLTIKCADEYGNPREVTYYRGDRHIKLFGKVEEIFELDRNGTFSGPKEEEEGK